VGKKNDPDPSRTDDLVDTTIIFAGITRSTSELRGLTLNSGKLTVILVALR
jgi:hypothetical protein